jgi:hypothetical protein
MAITSQNSPTAKWTARAPAGVTPDTAAFIYQSSRNNVPFFIENWIVSLVPADMDGEWLDTSGCTLITFQIVSVGAFSGSFQASINGGVTFQDVVAEVGANPITAAGFWRFRGAYEFMRFKATAVATSVTVSVSAVTGA